MARIVWDGLEAYSGVIDQQFLTKWDAIVPDQGGTGAAVDSASRFSGSKYFTVLGVGFLTKFFTSRNRVIIGYAMKHVGVLHPMFQFKDGSTVQVIAMANADGTFSFRQTSRSGTVLFTTSVIQTGGLWNFFEVDITFHASAGTIDVYKNSTLFQSASSKNTAISGTAQANRLDLGMVDSAGNPGAFQLYDDVYCLDTTGSAPWNDRLGDVRVYPLRPSGAGTTTQMTPSTGSNYQNVDEIIANDDTDYNFTNTITQRDLYAFGDLPGSLAATIFGIAHTSRWRKDDAGPRTAAQVLKDGSTTTVETAQSLATAYQSYATVNDQSLRTSAPYTISDVNALEAGGELST